MCVSVFHPPVFFPFQKEKFNPLPDAFRTWQIIFYPNLPACERKRLKLLNEIQNESSFESLKMREEKPRKIFFRDKTSASVCV